MNGVQVGSLSSTGFDVHEVIQTISGEQRLAKMFHELLPVIPAGVQVGAMQL